MTKFILVMTSFISITQANAFSVPDHRLITEIALEELNECQLLPNSLVLNSDQGTKATQTIIKANVDEDNYLKNGIKKLLVYSHFYNPFRPLKNELLRAHHADSAVKHYTQKILKNFNESQRLQLSKDNQQELGKMIHLIQDTSSAPHALWVNHGMKDGFENIIRISKFELQQAKISCNEITLANLNSPMEIMKASALGTIKQLEESVEFLELPSDGSEPRVNLAPWSQTFYTNDRIYTNKTRMFLREYDLMRPNLNTPTTDDSNQEGWAEKKLGRGDYGPLSREIKNILIRGDNFGNSREFVVGNKKYKIEHSQYVNLKKTLMRQAILNTQRTILWLNTL